VAGSSTAGASGVSGSAGVAGAGAGGAAGASSECDPAVAASCPTVASTYPEACIDVGQGTPLGVCVPGCDPLTNDGCGGDRPSCHVSPLGEGYCSDSVATAGAGSTCQTSADCASGYGCLSSACWKYCTDATVGTQCKQGATCQTLPGTTVPTSTAGICSESE
jgi:hypothetical protein